MRVRDLQPSRQRPMQKCLAGRVFFPSRCAFRHSRVVIIAAMHKAHKEHV